MLIWIILVIVILLVIWVTVGYNGLVRSRMQTQEVQLKRRNDLIPNLLETVKGYAKYEQSTLEKVTELRSKVANASTPNEAMKASDALGKQMASILAVAESYPDLKSNQNFLKLQE